MTALGLALVLAGLWATIALAPATPVARLLRAWLVDAPARRLTAIRSGTVYTLAIFAAILAAIALIDAEAFRIASFAAPETISWLALIDAGTMADVAFTALLARSALRLHGVRAWVAARLPRPRARRRRPRIRPEARKPANDDDRPRIAA